MTCQHPTLQRADDGRCCDCDVMVPSWLAMRDALYSVLNIEGAALSGSRLGAHEGLDTTYHFDKVRAALALAEQEG